ncbi:MULTISPECIES: hypothetical protein [Streptomycetaceae]|uniref:Uncharacterized protein n=1 Tax=Streptantibioticus cattleyicolor (strain ATCC 35852 / DSM 46488 / JCM 4925 / NBRC 14057 / NRRL 8057) TaxID=1003195 RepID=F8JRY4_STREN|nr:MULTISPECIES: hypothetical protein [Streptomycetaceae]AEW92895.1 hypothetical protein SCATT_05240 [Streptantibioticus cattleyicolor NRRL 8057 = DSM 46488]MYS57645.1 hypothetical protein [Streptomyces sp. SID5468]CCB73251.1 protein of unknown function [Streptantibioticus cattleyicolor NRRL 8057 = DSM 46488]
MNHAPAAPPLTGAPAALFRIITAVCEAAWNVRWEADAEFHTWRLMTSSGRARWGLATTDSVRPALATASLLAHQSGLWITQAPSSPPEPIDLTTWCFRFAAWNESHRPKRKRATST